MFILLKNVSNKSCPSSRDLYFILSKNVLYNEQFTAKSELSLSFVYLFTGDLFNDTVNISDTTASK
jgi:hypothetical protein